MDNFDADFVADFGADFEVDRRRLLLLRRCFLLRGRVAFDFFVDFLADTPGVVFDFFAGVFFTGEGI